MSLHAGRFAPASPAGRPSPAKSGRRPRFLTVAISQRTARATLSTVGGALANSGSRLSTVASAAHTLGAAIDVPLIAAYGGPPLAAPGTVEMLATPGPVQLTAGPTLTNDGQYNPSDE